MEKIETKILTLSNELLIKKLEDEWSALETLQENLERKMKHQENEEENLEEILSQIEWMITDPVGMRKKSVYEIRQLLSMVRFSGILYYEKNL